MFADLATLGESGSDIEYPDIDVLYSSPLLRCRQTAALLYPDMDVIPVPNLTLDFTSP